MRTGIHGDNRERWPEQAFRKLSLGRFALVKMMSNNHLEVFRRVQQLLPQAHVITRLFWPERPPEPAAFLEALSPRIEAIYSLGYHHFELLNEPNTPWEGWDSQGARHFDAWALEAIPRLRDRFPGIYLLWPGLAVNPEFQDIAWWRTCWRSIAACDALAAHAYWQPEWAMLDRQWGLRFQVAHELYPDKPLWVTEAGCTDPTVSKERRAQLYSRYLEHIATLGIEGVALWILDGSPEWEEQQNAHFDEAMALACATLSASDSTPLPITAPGRPTTRVGNLEGLLDLRDSLPSSGAYPSRPLQDIRWLVVHHSGMDADSSAYAIAAYHVQRLGWPGIGYHFLVHQDGAIEYVGDVLSTRYNVAGLNRKVVGICLTGDFGLHSPGETQLFACRDLLANLQFALGWFVPIVGHREIALPRNPTLCPGDTFLEGPRWREAITIREEG